MPAGKMARVREAAMFRARHLRVVPSGGSLAQRPADAGRVPSTDAAPARGDLAVLVMLFGVNLVPLAGEAFTRVRWGAGTLGLATAGALVTGRELLLEARSLVRRRR
jgi:hypothetical protein